MWLRRGQLAQAQRWVHKQNLSVADDLTYLREFEHITLARVLIADSMRDRSKHALPEVMPFLERLLKAAEESGRIESVIEILLLQALVCQAQGDLAIARTRLGRAIELAEPEGYIQLFVDEGLPMAELLSDAAAHGIMPDYTSKLLAQFETMRPTEEDRRPSPAIPSPPSQLLIQPLSEREIEILQLVAQGFSNREIGTQLFLALDTIKGHNRRIYNKLQVKSRMEAVARGRELGLLE